jgi:hypothetical protein
VPHTGLAKCRPDKDFFITAAHQKQEGVSRRTLRRNFGRSGRFFVFGNQADHFEERTMISRIIGGAAVAALVFAAAPASAMKMASCNQKNMDKADAMLMKMPDGENKMMGMQEMTSAKSSMSQKDMAGCQDHMNKAMKMGMMKSKKM